MCIPLGCFVIKHDWLTNCGMEGLSCMVPIPFAGYPSQFIIAMGSELHGYKTADYFVLDLAAVRDLSWRLKGIMHEDMRPRIWDHVYARNFCRRACFDFKNVGYFVHTTQTISMPREGWSFPYVLDWWGLWYAVAYKWKTSVLPSCYILFLIREACFKNRERFRSLSLGAGTGFQGCFNRSTRKRLTTSWAPSP